MRGAGLLSSAFLHSSSVKNIITSIATQTHLGPSETLSFPKSQCPHLKTSTTGTVQKKKEGAEELAEQGRALVLVEDQGSVPITYPGQLIETNNCSSSAPMFASGLYIHVVAHAGMQTHTHK